MQRPQIEWHHRKGNQLITDQRAYDQEALQRFVNAGLPTLNVKQRGLYDAVMESVQQDVGSPFLISRVIITCSASSNASPVLSVTDSSSLSSLHGS